MSDAYYPFWEYVCGFGFPAGDARVVLVDDTYIFDAAHASVAAAIMPHAIGDVTAELPLDGSSADPTRNIGDRAAVGFRATENVEFADADTSYPVATLKAVVLYAADAPLLYLDHESFGALPTVTLGGAVELHVKSVRSNDLSGPYLQLASGAWLVEVGP